MLIGETRGFLDCCRDYRYYLVTTWPTALLLNSGVNARVVPARNSGALVDKEICAARALCY